MSLLDLPKLKAWEFDAWCEVFDKEIKQQKADEARRRREERQGGR